MEIELRVVLLVVGLIILLVVAYEHIRRDAVKNKSLTDDHSANRNYIEPRPISLPKLEDTSELEFVRDIYETQADAVLPREIESEYEPEPESELEEDVEYIQPESNHSVITISIMSRDPYGFLGSDLLDALEGAQLVFGRNEVFRRIEDDEVLFTVVNAVEPGYFILETMSEEHIPGVTFILLPEDVSNSQQAFDKFIRTAKQISFALNGELLDHLRQPLTLTTIEQYRKQAELVAV